MIRVLLVDDEPAILDLERQILERKFGFSIVTVESGEEALIVLQTGRFDAIISDFLMPGMDGLALLRKIRERDKQIPFILFTVKESEEIALEALNSGANFYAHKEETPHTAFAVLAHKVTTAVELVRAENNLRTQRDLAISCANSKDIHEIIKFSLQAVIEVSCLDAAAIYLIDEREHLYLARTEGFSEAYTQSMIQAHLIPLFFSFLRGTESIFRDHQMILLYSRILSSEENINSDAIIPLMHHGRSIGLIHLASYYEDTTLTASFKRSLNGIALQIAGHISDQLSEDALRESERKLQSLFGNLPGMVYKCQYNEERTMELVSEGSVALTGHSPEDLVEKQNPSFYSLIHPDDRSQLMEVIQRAVIRHVQFRLTYRIFTSSMKFKWVWDQGAAIYDTDGQVNGLEGFIIDITRQKMLDDQVKNSQNRINMIFSAMDTGCTIFHEVELKGGFTLIEMNQAAERIEKKKKEEILGKSFNEVFHSVETEELQKAFMNLIIDGKPRTLPRIPFHTPQGRQWREIYLTPSPHSQNREVFLIYSDVTDRVRDEEQLIASLQEKELLLKEVHHRVKNNLQIISGILKLQAMRTTDPITNEVLQDCRNQVFSMASIHELLYNSRDISKIRVGQYVDNLINHLKQEYQGTGTRIHFISDIDPEIILDIERCITCGLILNELITNAVKYAFEPGGEGEIRVTFRHEGSIYVMEVADNGRGMPAGEPDTKPTSLGRELVNRLTHQIHGIITMSGEKGTKITIKFHDNPAVKVAP